MIKKISFLMIVGVSVLLMGSCVSKKKYQEMETKYQRADESLAKATLELNRCQEALSGTERVTNRNEDEIRALRDQNRELINRIGDLTQMSRQDAQNMQFTLQTMRERDVQIRSLRDALTRRDSINFALVRSLKGVIGMDDPDIEVNVEKGVIFISISDKFLFASGRWDVTPKAKEVLGKVAKVVNNHPNLEVMIEGHTDNVPFRRNDLADNWDLSVKRATSLARILQNDFNVAPNRMIAAGRGEYVPVDTNLTPTGRANNRRTRIIVLPKLEEFVDMIKNELGE